MVLAISVAVLSGRHTGAIATIFDTRYALIALSVAIVCTQLGG